jgi:outer membrane murein-binding lipoprotein Lpp
MKTRAAIAICLAGAAIAGCSSTEDYVDDVNAIQEKVVKASRSVGSDLNASKEELVKELGQAKAEAEQAVTDLENVDVPEDAEAGHDELIKGFAQLEKLYGNVKKGIESGSGGAAFEELRTKGDEIDKQIDDALDQINKDLGLG